MTLTEFNRLLKTLCTAGRLDPAKAKALDNTIKEKLVSFIVRKRAPIVIELIPENHPFVGYSTMRTWLDAMGYLFTTTSGAYTFVHTCEHIITNNLTWRRR